MLSEKMNDAVETIRQAAAVRSFIEQDLIQRVDAQDEIIRLIELLMNVSSDIIALIYELSDMPDNGGELSTKARQLLAELRIEVDHCRQLLDEHRDIFLEAV